jgi:hypothetical protein
MPVVRYRDVSEMPAPPPIEGEDLAARIRAVWRRAVELAQLSPRPGVTRFRSLEEAQEAREQETAQRMRRIRRERARAAGPGTSRG